MYTGPVRKDGSIFVSVASYRDDECTKTVRELLDKARFPGLVYVGVVQQNKEASEDCATLRGAVARQLRVMTLGHTEARGPCYARYLATSLYRGETFFFQIDSHTRFAKNWDETLRKMWADLKDPKAVLSHYPKDYNDEDRTSVPINCLGDLQQDGIIRMGAMSMAPRDRPVPTYWGGAGFLFGPGEMLADVPYDPDLDMLFHGEEILYSARLFTHGYTIYAPNANTAFHWYGRDGKPKFWEDVFDPTVYQRMQSESLQKVRDVLGVPGAKHDRSKDRYGLGSKRKLTEFWRAVGVDWKNIQNTKKVNNCNRV